LSNTPDLGPVPQRVTVTAPQVRRLIEEQFPQWAGLPVQPVASGGWDNWTFHLGAGMLVRLPIPVPLVKGDPGADYPYSWSVYPWLDGEPASADRIADPVRFAADLAGFLTALRSTDPAGGPRPGKHNWFRGGTLRTYDGAAQSALTGRQVFRERLSAGEAEWSRGRGWALWKTLVTCARTLNGDDEEEAAGARRVLGEIFSVTK
jgi:aminoglycoside phosphotransferase (APT) family kinase protein